MDDARRAAGFVLAVVAPWDVLGPALAKESLGGAKAWGFIESAYSLGALGGGALVLRLRVSRPLLVATTLNLLYIPALVAFAVVSPVIVIAVAAFIGGAANDAYLVLFDTTIQRLVPRDLLARGRRGTANDTCQRRQPPVSSRGNRSSSHHAGRAPGARPQYPDAFASYSTSHPPTLTSRYPLNAPRWRPYSGSPPMPSALASVPSRRPARAPLTPPC